MHNPESVLKNEIYNVLWDFEMSASQPDLEIVNKKENLPNRELCYSSSPQGKTERKWKERYIPRPC